MRVIRLAASPPNLHQGQHDTPTSYTHNNHSIYTLYKVYIAIIAFIQYTHSIIVDIDIPIMVLYSYTHNNDSTVVTHIPIIVVIHTTIIVFIYITIILHSYRYSSHRSFRHPQVIHTYCIQTSQSSYVHSHNVCTVYRASMQHIPVIDIRIITVIDIHYIYLIVVLDIY